MVDLTEQDLLTGLLHGNAFGRRVDPVLRRAAERQEPYAVIVAELPPNADDGALIDAARRVRDVIRSRDLVARTGVAELGVCCPGASEPEARAVARRIAEALRQPFEIGGELLGLDVGVGAFLRETAGADDSAGFALLAARAMIDRAA
jgi:GGDEF domain-containing protein